MTKRAGLAALLLIISCAVSPAQSVNFKDFRLKNGLRVILSEDHSAPTYSLAVTYNVGSRDEKQGRTGFAHLFEHMMFQGTSTTPGPEFRNTIARYGGRRGFERLA